VFIVGGVVLHRPLLSRRRCPANLQLHLLRIEGGDTTRLCNVRSAVDASIARSESRGLLNCTNPNPRDMPCWS
jgi:hypothetical protein